MMGVNYSCRHPDRDQVDAPSLALFSPRLFRLVRDVDVTGISGSGYVADGVLWCDGTVSIRWLGERPSIVFWQSLADAEAVHGHGGAARFVWADGG